MNYQHLIDLLLKELIEKMKEYIDGQVIYIPKKKENIKCWGENTNRYGLCKIFVYVKMTREMRCVMNLFS